MMEKQNKEDTREGPVASKGWEKTIQSKVRLEYTIRLLGEKKNNEGQRGSWQR